MDEPMPPVQSQMEDVAHAPAELSSPAVEITASDLEAVFDVPVKIRAVLGSARLTIADLLAVNAGTVLSLDRKVGEAIDIFVNNRLVARGEVVLLENKLGVTLTEIVSNN